HDPGRALVLNALGWHHGHLGQHEPAVTYCERAIALHQHIGDSRGEAFSWDSLAFAWHRAGSHARAVTADQRAGARLGDRAAGYWEAVVTDHLGHAYAALRRGDAARAAWRRCADLLTALGHPDVRDVVAKLGHPSRRVDREVAN